MEVIEREELQRRVNTIDPWYHTLELPHGIVTPGVFDMRPHVEHYGFPDSLRGKRALDVGTSNGFFAFELERRRADVVASELASELDHDVPEVHRRALGGSPDVVRPDLLRGFDLARSALNSQVTTVRARICDLPDHFTDEFDLVLVSNVLLHVRDPVLAFESFLTILKPGGQLIVANPVEESVDASYALFLGTPENAAWWIPSSQALLRMAAFAGFDAPTIVDRFHLSAPRIDSEGSMVVMHAHKHAASLG